MTKIHAAELGIPFTAAELRKLRHKVRKQALHMGQQSAIVTRPDLAERLGNNASVLLRAAEALGEFADTFPADEVAA